MVIVKYFLAIALAVFFLMGLVPLMMYVSSNIILFFLGCVLSGVVSAVTAYAIADSIVDFIHSFKKHP